tara:strand:- start:1742 stop:2227 length:486 start_codon:yes stop_codon:yes gene_type:complete
MDKSGGIMPEWNTELVGIAVDISGLAITLAGFIFIVIQIRRLGQSIRTTAHAAIYSQAADFRTHLMAYPELRKYFFDGVDIERGHPDFERAITLSECFLNYLEHLAVQKSHFAGADGDAWTEFASRSLERSPITKRRLKNNDANYSPKLLALLRDDSAVAA